MSNFMQDLKKAASVGQQAYSDYSSGKGLSEEDKQNGEQAAKTLYNDYESRNGSNSNSNSSSGSGSGSGSDSNNLSGDAQKFENSSAGKDAEGFLQKQF